MSGGAAAIDGRQSLNRGDCFSVRRLAVCASLGAAVALPGHFQTALYAFSGAAVLALASAAFELSASNCCITHPCASIFAGVVERAYAS